jgi:hypothetical protein
MVAPVDPPARLFADPEYRREHPSRVGPTARIDMPTASEPARGPSLLALAGVGAALAVIILAALLVAGVL